MSMLQNRSSPNIPQAPAEYDVAYMNAFSNVIRLFFNNINTVQQLNLAALNLDLRTLPTDADYVNLRLGDVYRDTQGGTLQSGTNILRIKVPIELAGVSGSGAVGSVGPVGGTITKNLTGVSGAGAVGTVTP
jgi:hypothetical protein